MSTVLIWVLLGICVFVTSALGFGWLSRRTARGGPSGWRASPWRAEWYQGMSTEMAGALIATVMFGLVAGYVDERDTKTTLQREVMRAQLIYDMGSLDNATALHAVERLRLFGWLENQTLKDKLFPRADLRQAPLAGAYLRGAVFMRATLYGADLRDTDLRGADFAGADLEGAQLGGALFDEKSVLPDGTVWTVDADLGRFTDAARADFWRSDDPLSPAYRAAA